MEHAGVGHRRGGMETLGGAKLERAVGVVVGAAFGLGSSMLSRG